MTPDELREAVAQFERDGGKIQVVAAMAATSSRQPPTPIIDAELVEAIRGFTSAGVCAAAKALGRSTRTINAIAALFGIKFETTTDATLADRRKEEARLVPSIRRMAREGVAQVTMAERLGIGRMTLRRIARYHGISINSRAP